MAGVMFIRSPHFSLLFDLLNAILQWLCELASQAPQLLAMDSFAVSWTRTLI